MSKVHSGTDGNIRVPSLAAKSISNVSTAQPERSQRFGQDRVATSRTVAEVAINGQVNPMADCSSIGCCPKLCRFLGSIIGLGAILDNSGFCRCMLHYRMLAIAFVIEKGDILGQWRGFSRQ